MKTSLLKNGEYTVRITGPEKIRSPRDLYLVLVDEWVSGDEFLRNRRKKNGEKYAAGNLRYYRRAARMTQAELAKAVGGSFRHHISEMESGKRPIGKGMARKLARALGVERVWASLLTDDLPAADR